MCVWTLDGDVVGRAGGRAGEGALHEPFPHVFRAQLLGQNMGNLMSVSFAPECTDLKTKHDDCFNQWYIEKFLKGKSLHNECADVWEDYIACVNSALARHKIKPMLDKAREEQPFEDSVKPSGSK